MQITLTDEEARIVKELLQADLDQLPTEVHHTQNHDVKNTLKNREVVVMNLLHRLENPTTPAGG